MNKKRTNNWNPYAIKNKQQKIIEKLIWKNNQRNTSIEGKNVKFRYAINLTKIFSLIDENHKITWQWIQIRMILNRKVGIMKTPVFLIYKAI